MPIQITEARIALMINDTVTAQAGRIGGAWQVTTWPHLLNYNRAIAALTFTECLVNGHPEIDPFVIAWREELASG